jgi:hypothetical protein
MPQTITVPPATDETIEPAGGTFAFYVASTCNICFGTATPPGSYPELENQTFQWLQGTTHSFPIPPNVGDSLPFNTSSPGVVCKPSNITDNGKVIVVGTGILTRKKKSKPKPRKAAVKKPAAKKTASKKTASRKAASKTAAKRKAAPKKKAPAKKKATAKKAKKAAKKKSAGKSRR